MKAIKLFVIALLTMVGLNVANAQPKPHHPKHAHAHHKKHGHRHHKGHAHHRKGHLHHHKK